MEGNKAKTHSKYRFSFENVQGVILVCYIITFMRRLASCVYSGSSGCPRIKKTKVFRLSHYPTEIATSLVAFP